MDINFPHTQKIGGISYDADKKPDPLHEAAKDIEASFVAEMLKSAGVGKVSEEWGGGIGEEQFSSFLIELQAEQIVNGGGFGLAEKIYENMKEQGND